MRTVLLGLFGSMLMIMGTLSGVGGLGLFITDPCSPTYRVSLQPADSGSGFPGETVSYGTLTEVQQIAVDAALENRSRMSFRDREPLAELTETVIEKNGTQYVANLITTECRSLYDDLAIVGLSSAIGGFFLTGFAFVAHRHS